MLELFIPGSLRQLIPDDHVVVRVDRVLDLLWLRAEVAECYCHEDGRPGIDREVAVRLMLAGLLVDIVHDRKLMHEAAGNIGICWFVGYGPHEKLPHHSIHTHSPALGAKSGSAGFCKRTLEAGLKRRSRLPKLCTSTFHSSVPT
jgi:hypothetical protein